MYWCITGSRTTNTAEIYRQTKTVDDTGQTQREWSLLSVMACQASRAYLYLGKPNEEWSGNTYRTNESIILKTRAEIERGDRVAGILDINSKDLWKESDTESTIFDVVGIDPITDGFGQFVEYEVFLSRSEVQNLGG